jgi:mercuric ion transport protein
MIAPEDQVAVSPSKPWLLRLGIVGTIVTALCCFTPLLVVLLGVVGLGAIVGKLDVVLFPTLGGFLLLTAYALWRRRRAQC